MKILIIDLCFIENTVLVAFEAGLKNISLFKSNVVQILRTDILLLAKMNLSLPIIMFEKINKVAI